MGLSSFNAARAREKARAKLIIKESVPIVEDKIVISNDEKVVSNDVTVEETKTKKTDAEKLKSKKK